MAGFSQVFGRLLDLVPAGAELESARDLVNADLVGDDDLRDLLIGEHPETIDVFELRGHAPRVRPILVALAARASGAERVDRGVQHTAELLHLALVVHDMALGREGGRRRRVARKVLKRSVSLLGGHHLTLRAMELSRSQPNMLSEVLDTLREFADGQALSRELQQTTAIPAEEDWLSHADAHMGALFSFCCRGGAWLGGADATERSALGRYGRHLGRVWHVAEDLSMLRHGDAGAHLVARVLAGRPVLAVIAAAAADPSLIHTWEALVTSPRIDVAERLAAEIMAGPAPIRCREAMLKESWSARKALRVLPDTRYRSAMDRLAASLAK